MTNTIKKSLSSFLAICMLFGLFIVFDHPITANASEELSNVSTISTTSVQKGQSIQINAVAKGGTGFYQYAVWYKTASDSEWTALQDFGSNSVVKFTPSDASDYTISVKVKDSGGQAGFLNE